MSAGAPEISLDALLAPDPTARAARGGGERSTLVAAAVVIVVVVIVAFATGALGSSGASYRTATVTRRAVDSELTSVATIEPVSQATVGFPTSGTVKSISVQVGDEVAAGDAPRATRHRRRSKKTCTPHEADLAQAQLTLENGLNGEKASSSADRRERQRHGPSARASTTGTRIVLTATTTDPELAAAQQAVLQGAGERRRRARDRVDRVRERRRGVLGRSARTPRACEDALDAALDAQKDVQTAQHQLVDGVDRLRRPAEPTRRAERRQLGSSGGSTPPGGTSPDSSSLPADRRVRRRRPAVARRPRRRRRRRTWSRTRRRSTRRRRRWQSRSRRSTRRPSPRRSPARSWPST